MGQSQARLPPPRPGWLPVSEPPGAGGLPGPLSLWAWAAVLGQAVTGLHLPHGLAWPTAGALRRWPERSQQQVPSHPGMAGTPGLSTQPERLGSWGPCIAGWRGGQGPWGGAVGGLEPPEQTSVSSFCPWLHFWVLPGLTAGPLRLPRRCHISILDAETSWDERKGHRESRSRGPPSSPPAPHPTCHRRSGRARTGLHGSGSG